jgi:hypothetical protein
MFYFDRRLNVSAMLPANQMTRWLVGGFIGTILVACYQLSGYLDQQLLNYKHFFHSQVLE